MNRSLHLPLISFLVIVLCFSNLAGCGGGTIGSDGGPGGGTKISGIVTDPTGIGITDAEITVLENGVSGRSNSNGLFETLSPEIEGQVSFLVEKGDFSATSASTSVPAGTQELRVTLRVNTSQRVVGVGGIIATQRTPTPIPTSRPAPSRTAVPYTPTAGPVETPPQPTPTPSPVQTGSSSCPGFSPQSLTNTRVAITYPRSVRDTAPYPASLRIVSPACTTAGFTEEDAGFDRVLVAEAIVPIGVSELNFELGTNQGDYPFSFRIGSSTAELRSIGLTFHRRALDGRFELRWTSFSGYGELTGSRISLSPCHIQLTGDGSFVCFE